MNELFTRYPDSSSHFLDPATEFLVAIDDGDTVGCIGLMPIVAGVGEIKRMFVRQDQRGRGIARFLILELEQYALRQGAELLRLATGERQPEAIALYESLGYQAAERYGKYVTDPVSRCYTKNLTPSPPEAELTTPSSVSCSPACRASSVLDASASPGSWACQGNGGSTARSIDKGRLISVYGGHGKIWPQHSRSRQLGTNEPRHTG